MPMQQPPANLPSTKPYLLRALWEWCNENGFTPYMTVLVDDYCRVPQEFIKNGEIVLNIGAEATHNLCLANEAITFQARFGGVAREIYVPMARVIALFARENGVGMGFPAEATVTLEKSESKDGSAPDDTPPPKGSPPFLRRVK